MKLLYVVGVLLSTYYIMDKLLYTWLPTNCVFDPDRLVLIANKVIATHNQMGNSTTEQLLMDVREELAKEYGDKWINPYEKDKWVFNNAGGAMGQMLILHASFSEYLILFGSATGNEGHSGVHFADDWFTILKGTQLASLPENPSPEVYNAGDVHLMRKGYAKQYSMARESYALEYARGWIPFMLPFGFLDTFTSTLDFYTLGKTVWITGRDMLRHLFVNGKF
ncbi:C-8 sterol isomerase [Lachancea thermotolerans]|uniref:C-8 sterol isomerase n=1 Tax=Lachancea thermotolerans (strain ATCC 56472 / CBS 6340 / NRRL Y-8284) TaxID=559295 RepID=C5DBW1_LACTC|nr:KLTH0A05786p [Lachancea thermotolerans CBS 6340]CAR21268.1 KLTH0A05786p [Lachancea thermotolerans CBS 6340]